MTGDESITAGEVIELGERQVRVVAYRDDGVVVRDYRKRVAVRNVATNRLSYVPEWRLLKAKRGQPTATGRLLQESFTAEDAQPIANRCAACVGSKEGGIDSAVFARFDCRWC